MLYSMTTLLNYKTTLEYLAYLGYRETPRISALQITKPRKAERRKGKSSRNTFLCYVCGAAGSGKTSLLRAFIGRKFDDAYEPTKRMNSVVNTVAIEGREINLVVGRSQVTSSCQTKAYADRAGTAARVWLEI